MVNSVGRRRRSSWDKKGFSTIKGEGCKIIDGKEIAEKILKEAEKKVLEIGEMKRPKLVAVWIGSGDESRIYLEKKSEAAKRIGMEVEVEQMGYEAEREEVKDRIKGLNEDESVDGIIVQLPVPPHLDENEVCNWVIQEKDVDGFTDKSLGRMIQSPEKRTLIPCTAMAVKTILCRAAEEIGLVEGFAGKNAVVVGRSLNVGLPISLLLAADRKKGGLDMTTTICHRGTVDIGRFISSGDVVVSAAGVPNLVRPEMVKPGAVVIDVGLNRIEVEEGGKKKRKLVGDCHRDVRNVAGALTPVPGGVGPCTVACLLLNTVLAAQRRLEKS